MLSKCANPICFARFLTLRRGRLFKIEKTVSSSSVQPVTRIEYFWLCEDCARVMKVVWRHGVVTTRPLYPELTVSAKA
ncbi:MAG: hypothetical protein WB952_16300 [Terriglobales bacterium]